MTAENGIIKGLREAIVAAKCDHAYERVSFRIVDAETVAVTERCRKCRSMLTTYRDP